MSQNRVASTPSYETPRLEPARAQRGPQGRYSPGEALGNILCNNCSGGGGN
jgi:hypothetical protein